MKLSDYIVNTLVDNGVSHVFEVAGGTISHLLDSFYKRKDIKLVSMHHEQAAAFAAEGYARSSNRLGVALATSGPGATNMLTGIGSCFFDSVPALFITGQVNTYEFKNNEKVRQRGFQETDIVNIAKPIVKKAIMIKDPKKIKYYLNEALFIAKEGRPGPVLIDIPMNVQRAIIDPNKLINYSNKGENNELDHKKIQLIAALIKRAERPIILIGQGAQLSRAKKYLFELVSRTHIPVVSTLLGKDCFPNDNSNYLGMIGTYGHRFANLAVANADLLLILGARLDTRQTGTQPKSFARGAKIIHVDIDPLVLNNQVKASYAFQCDCAEFLVKLYPYLKGYDFQKIKPWLSKIGKFVNKLTPKVKYNRKSINPNEFMRILAKELLPEGIICADVGQHQMWAAQSLKLRGAQRFITQGGMGAMGSALSMAIGASFANPGKIVVAISGDGGFQLNSQELQTIYYHQLPIKIIIINNKCYGMVKQFQKQYFNSRFQSTVVGYNCPDFQRIAKAYFINNIKVNNIISAQKNLHRMFSNRKPMLLEVIIDSNCEVLPKLSVNRPIEDQDPLLPRKTLKSLMNIRIYEK